MILNYEYLQKLRKERWWNKHPRLLKLRNKWEENEQKYMSWIVILLLSLAFLNSLRKMLG